MVHTRTQFESFWHTGLDYHQSDAGELVGTCMSKHSLHLQNPTISFFNQVWKLCVPSRNPVLDPFVTEICQATIQEILKIGTSNREIAIFLVFLIPGKLLRDFSEDWKIGKCRSRHFPIFQNSGGNTSIWEMCHLWFVAFSHNLSILWSWIRLVLSFIQISPPPHVSTRFDTPAFRVRFLSFGSASSAWSWIFHGFRVASWISQIDHRFR